jgi:hypothetical protein
MYVPIKFLRFDYFLQSILIGFNLLLTLGLAFNFVFIIYLLRFQFFLGIAQFTSALAHYFRPNLSGDIKRWRKYHLVASIAFLVILILSVVFDVHTYEILGNWGTALLYYCAIFFIPQAFAYSYYFLLRLDYQKRREYIENRISFTS